jgi:hypothetical protein
LKRADTIATLIQKEMLVAVKTSLFSAVKGQDRLALFKRLAKLAVTVDAVCILFFFVLEVLHTDSL